MKAQFIFVIAVLGLGLTAILSAGAQYSDYSNFGGEINQESQFSVDTVQDDPVQGFLQLALGETGIFWLDTLIILPLQIVSVFIGISIIRG